VARAVDGASFVVPKGRIVGLVGESGCGKTTAVRAIMGVLAENGWRAGGRVAFKGPGDRRDEHRPLLWRDIAYVPQSAMSSLESGLHGGVIDRRSTDQARPCLPRSLA